MAKTLSLEGQKYNIFSNALVPTAGSRLTETVMPEDLVQALKPEFVTPLVIYLTHESCHETGQIFEAGAGWYGTVQLYRGKGKVIPHATAEDCKIRRKKKQIKVITVLVQANWSNIVDMSKARHYQAGELMNELVSALGEHGSTAPSGGNSGSGGGNKRSSLQSAPIFEEIANGLKENAAAAKNVKAIIMYILLKDGKEVAKYSKNDKRLSKLNP